MRCLGSEVIRNQDCWIVEFVHNDGEGFISAFEKESGFLVRTQMLLRLESGPTEVISRFRNYKDFEGVMLPTYIRENTGETQYSLILTDAVFNRAFDQQTFAMPESVHELLHKHEGTDHGDHDHSDH